MRALSLLAATAIATLAALPASAAPISTTVNFSLGGLLDINDVVPVPPPVSATAGSFTVTFDPTLASRGRPSIRASGLRMTPSITSFGSVVCKTTPILS